MDGIWCWTKLKLVGRHSRWGGRKLISPWIEPKNHVDDEYAKVGTYDPKIVITTSRSPSSRLLQFSKVGLVYLSLPKRSSTSKLT